MREHLYRGKVKGTAEWRYWDCFGRIDGSSTINPDAIYVRTVSEWTGLLDKNGNKIFEGDVVKVEQTYTAVVEYTRFFPAFVEHTVEWDNFKNLTNYSEKYEVIGNKWDNPELLGGNND